MSENGFEVCLVDDDAAVLRSLRRLLEAAGYGVRTFETAREFLASNDPAVPGCVVVDLSLPDIDGLALQRTLVETCEDRQVLFLTGHADVHSCVRAMQAGALDYLVKPVEQETLLRAVRGAEARDRELRLARASRNEVKERLALLTPREREVLDHVISGQLNKQIAADLGTVEKTIKVHRGRMMTKMGVRTVAELVHLTDSIGLVPYSKPGAVIASA